MPDAEQAGVAANNLPAACFSLVGFIPAPTRSGRIWGLGVVMGEGARSAVFPRTFRKPPVRRGKGAKLGAGVAMGGWVGVETRIAGPTLFTLLANWERAQKRVEPAL